MPNAFKMLLGVIIPYLRITEKEKEDIIDNPKEFVNYTIDICQKQESKTHKSQAAKLLEHIVDHIDGMLTFTVNLLLEITQHLLSGGNPQNQLAANEMKDKLSKFSLNTFTDEELLDISLLSLTILSYTLVKRPDLLGCLDKIVVDHLPKLINMQQMPSPLIQSRITLFLGFYIDQLLTTTPRQVQTEYFSRILDFLLISLNMPKERKIVAL